MSQLIDISVIVPIFNQEHQLKQCLESFKHQDFAGNFEVIMIDDFSGDNSARMAWQFCKARSHQYRFVQNQQQIGSVASIKRGIDLARGNYNMVIDPSEALDIRALSTFFRTAVTDNFPVEKTAS